MAYREDGEFMVVPDVEAKPTTGLAIFQTKKVFTITECKEQAYKKNKKYLESEYLQIGDSL
jgi:hypothetical protein